MSRHSLSILGPHLPASAAGSASAAAAPALANPIEAALDLRAKGQVEEAIGLLSHPASRSADSCNLRGDLQLGLGRIADAIGSYFAAIAADAGNIYAHFQLARCLCRMKQWEEAASTFRKVLSYDAHRDDARVGLGECLLQLNRMEEALSCFEACWSTAARVSAEFGKAVALQLLCRFDEAEAAYERVLALDPNPAEALSNLIAMSVERFELEKVRRYAQRLLDLDSQSVAALKGLALVALERKDLQAAANYFSRLEKMGSGSIPAARATGGAIEYHVSPDIVARLRHIGSRPGSSKIFTGQ